MVQVTHGSNMSKPKIGKLPRRYKFILNRYPDERLSSCPLCKKQTHQRKFAFFIHIDSFGPITMGKTGKYCSNCELIILHQHELETELSNNLDRIAPEAVGNGYLVIGTVEKKIWQKGIKGKVNGIGVNDLLQNMADFKKVYELDIDPGGWYPADRK
jgi:hypothetical protein